MERRNRDGKGKETPGHPVITKLRIKKQPSIVGGRKIRVPRLTSRKLYPRQELKMASYQEDA